jgi:hypothetical protein
VQVPPVGPFKRKSMKNFGNIKKTTENLRKAFPLFKFEVTTNWEGRGYIRVWFSDYNYCAIYRDNLGERTKELEIKHKNKEKEVLLQKQFPHLYFMVLSGTSKRLAGAYSFKNPDCLVSVWVLYDNKDREFLGDYSITNKNLLERLDGLAKRAKKENKFICSNCFQLHDFGHNVFAGYYCQYCFENNQYVQQTVKASWKPNFYE